MFMYTMPNSININMLQSMKNKITRVIPMTIPVMTVYGTSELQSSPFEDLLQDYH